MKKILLVAFLCLLCIGLKAQNIQVHYDFGRNIYDRLEGRPLITTTVEMFKGDTWGSTYFFVDMDYTKNGVAGAYWEVSRELKFWEPPFSVHVEYNGGLSNGGMFDNAYLLGATYTYNSADFTKGVTFTPMYKYIQKHKSPNSFQLTGTWYVHFSDMKFSFTGFWDFWREADCNAAGKDFIFISEPQFWVNLDKFKRVNDKFNLSVGTEWELSQNFGGREGFFVIPTLALKWTFD